MTDVKAPAKRRGRPPKAKPPVVRLETAYCPGCGSGASHSTVNRTDTDDYTSIRTKVKRQRRICRCGQHYITAIHEKY